MFGSGGAVVLAWLLWQACRSPAAGAGPEPPQSFWLWFVGCVVILGTAASGGVDDWGVAHLCLQGLLVLGLAFVAARIGGVGPGWKVLLALGLAADLTLGIGLPFYLENIARPPSTLSGNGGAELIATYGWGAWGNLRQKLENHLEFVGDWPVSRPLLITLLGCLLTRALYDLRRVRTTPEGPA
jgi:hypothetical protein